MCLIILKSAGVNIHNDIIETAYQRNGDGFGVMYMNGKIPTVRKNIGMSLEKVKELLGSLKDKEVGVHFRMRTAGNVSYENCHPFVVTSEEDRAGANNLIFMHNGTLGNLEVKMVGGESDTYALVHKVLRPVLMHNPDVWRLPSFKAVVEGLLGLDKALMLDGGKKEFVVFNEKSWTTAHGVKLSNTYAWHIKNTSSSSFTINKVVEEEVEGFSINEFKKMSQSEAYNYFVTRFDTAFDLLWRNKDEPLI